MPNRPADPRTYAPAQNDVLRRLRELERNVLRLPEVVIPDIPEPGGPYTITVAADDTPGILQDRADFVCSGTSDQGIINAAISKASEPDIGSQARGGLVHLMPGTYELNGDVFLPNRVRLRGSGEENTVLNGGNITTLGDSGNYVNTSNVVEDLKLVGSITLGGGFGSTPLFSVFRAWITGNINLQIGWGTGVGRIYDCRVGGGITYSLEKLEVVRCSTGSITDSGNHSEDVLISDNFVTGTIAVVGGINVVSSWMIHNNSANNIVVGHINGAQATIDNVLIIGNHLTTSATAIWLKSRTQDCTVALNCAPDASVVVDDDGTNNLDFVNQCGGPDPFAAASGREYSTVVVAAVDSHTDGQTTANFLCDGIADDDTIELAIASLPTIGGFKQGRIILLEGNYTFAAPCVIGTAKKNLEIRGMGWGTRIVGGGYSAFVIGDATPSNFPTGVTVADLFIDCNDVASSVGIRLSASAGSGNVTDVLIENVKVERARTRAIIATGDRWTVSRCRITGTSTVNHQGVQVGSAGSRVEDCFFDDVSTAILAAAGTASISRNEIGSCADGISVTSMLLGVIANNRIGACDVGPGIGVTSGDSLVIVGNTISYVPSGAACIDILTGSEGPQIIGNTIDSPDGIGIRTVVDMTQITSNQVDWTGEEGLIVDGADDVQITNNRLANGGWGTANTFDGIFLTNSDRATVMGNIVRSSDYRYSVNISDATCNDTLICDNDLLNGFVTGDVNDAGTTTRDCASGGHIIEDEGVGLTQQPNLNFVGAGVTVTDSAPDTIVTIPGGAGHVIQDEGVSLAARTNLNFVGAGVTVTDDAGNDQTDVTISGGGGGGGDTLVAWVGL